MSTMLPAAISHPSWRTLTIAAGVLVLTVAVGMPPANAAAGTARRGLAVPTTTTPPTAPPQPSDGGSLRDRLPPPFGNGPGFFDIGERINAWFRDLAASALDPLLDLVGRTILATPDLAAAGSRVRELWLVSAGIANTGFVLLIVAGGVLVMSHETLQSSYSAKEIAPRLVLAFVAANLSLLLAGQAIPLANALAGALLDTSTDPDHVRATLKTLALAPVDTSSGLLIFLAIALAVMAVGLVAAYRWFVS